MHDADADAATTRFATALALLWLAGNALRITILSVPPVIAPIRDELGLNATEVGVLSGVGPAMFATTAIVGSVMVARLGLKAALIGGLAIVAIGSALRGLSTGFATLLATSILMAAGVAIMQPAMPTAVRQWVPGRIGLGTAVYGNGLLVGECVPVLLTIPWLLPLVGGSWRASFVAWALPIAIIAILLHALAPKGPVPTAAAARRWMPDWRAGLVWRLGALIGSINAVYFATNAFLSIYLADEGRADLIAGALIALNVAQLPGSLLLLAVAHRLEGRWWPFLAAGVLALASVLGLVFAVGPWTIVWASLFGVAEGGGLIVALMLPARLCRPEDVARTSAGMFTLSYGGALVVGVLSGVVWDLSGRPALAFVPIAACAVVLMAMPIVMRARGELR
jgi:CP family cyanate transporter-like MFS transporter